MRRVLRPRHLSASRVKLSFVPRTFQAYRPLAWRVGLGVSGASALVLAGLLLAGRREVEP